jgi:hypothetical protein
MSILSSYDPSDFLIYAGDVNQNGNGVIHHLYIYNIHQGYNQTDNFFNNIALIRVSKPLKHL